MEGLVMPSRGRRISDEERGEIVEMYTNGLVMRQVATQIGRSYGAVNMVLHAEGIPINPRGGYRRGWTAER